MHRSLGLLAGAALLLAPGCGRGDRREGLAPVTGRVTFNGQPVPAGQLHFYPMDGKRSSSGTITTDGTYALTSYRPGDGALIGKHKVVIDATEQGQPLPNPDDPDAFKSGIPRPPKRILPAPYYDRTTTPLETEVKDENNVINFDIPS